MGGAAVPALVPCDAVPLAVLVRYGVIPRLQGSRAPQQRAGERGKGEGVKG